MINGFELAVITLLGLLFGSFLNVVAYRVPRHESIVHPGSYCTSCHHELRPWDLIPVLSWIILRGRCRYCRAPISIRYPMLEIATSLLFLWSGLHTILPLQRITWWVFWMLLMAVVGTDLTSMKVPNVLSYSGAIIVFLLSGLSGIQTWKLAVTGALTCFAVLFLIFLLSRGNMGLGDAKLYVSIGAILGPGQGIESLIFASFIAALIGIVLRFMKVLKPRQHIPFVPFIAGGVVITVLYGSQLWQSYQLLILHVI